MGYSEERIKNFKKKWLDNTSNSTFNEAFLIIPGDDYHWMEKIEDIIFNHRDYYQIAFVNTFKDYEIYRISLNN